MKFEYPDLSTIDCDGRWYITPGAIYYPSITTVLGHTEDEGSRAALNAWRDSMGHAEADAYTKARADHGTVVHLLAERFLKGEDVDAPIDGTPVAKDDMGAFRTLKPTLAKIEEVWGQEVALYSRELEIAGRCDLIGVFKGRPCIIDFKTSGRIKSDDDILNYKHQLCFYGQAHNEMFGTDIKHGTIIMVVQSGFPMIFNVNLEEHTGAVKERSKAFWLKRLAQYA